MSYITTLTNAQLQTARDQAIKVQQALQKFAQGTVTFTVTSGAITGIALS